MRLIVELIVLQASIVREKIEPRRQTEYLPLISFLDKYPHSKVMGSSALGFGIGFDRVIDDARLGCWSGKSADFIVSDYWYRWDWEINFKYCRRTGAYSPDFESYRPVAAFGEHTVYRREPSIPFTAATPSVRFPPPRSAY